MPRITPVDLRVQRLHAVRLFAKFGLRRRAFTVPQTKDDVAQGGTLTEAFITLPKKGWILGLGFQSAASDVVLATGDTIQLRTADGTILATFVSGSDYTLGSGRATMRPNHPDGTFVATNKPMILRVVGTSVGVRGSVYWFVDYEPSDEVGRA